MQKHNVQKSGTQTFPDRKKYGFTKIKHTFSEIPSIPKKLQKWGPNHDQTTPNASYARQKTAPAPEKKRTENKQTKTTETCRPKLQTGTGGWGGELSEGSLDLEGLAAWMHVKT